MGDKHKSTKGKSANHKDATPARSSRITGFYKLPPSERRALVAGWAQLTATETQALDCGLDQARADALIENVIGCYTLPLGVATNFRVNDRDVLVPMVVEEPSVVAAASYGALLAREGGGFQAESDEPVMIGQIQVCGLAEAELEAAAQRVEAQSEAILAAAGAPDGTIARLGGGARSLDVRRFPETPAGPMLVVHIYYDTRDAMGANAVNTACEAAAPLVERAAGGRVVLRILSNLADRRLARARCTVPARALARQGISGRTVAERIVEANALAVVDPYRAATHNKGAMNGVDAVVVATGNDWRGAEAAAHAYASRDGQYRSLTEWRLTPAGDLSGSIELPLALGTVGGGTRAYPSAAVSLKILGVSSAPELACIVASAGLAQNLAALRALATEGIQPGHMALHARQLALAAGATGEAALRIAHQLVAEGEIRLQRAKELVLATRAPRSNPAAT
jgi:hydroxymethylglutaryl-CoA reductase